ncbi:haloacid dehalogenase-like hydrolase domain-containing 5 [Apostichopus japonicus]|uniref:haloacid dehalogenase-like hydrolase domain-containing 5 n=1 Tax=Stichopus japonicus TaxID=307972 RepID=UPI003AB3CA62
MNGTAAMQNTFRVSRVICRIHEPTRQFQHCRFSSSDTNVTEVKKPHFGLLFDIDGVLVRGKRLLPQAVEAFRKISAFNPKANRRELTVPTVFVTNAGNALRQTKARQLSEWLGVHVSESQVVMSHSPLKILPQFHDKHVLVSGQGPVKDIARGLGFKKITTIDELSDMFPQLDAVDHKRRTNTPQSELGNYLAPIEALILFGEPVRWETALQFMIDVLVTNGRLQSSPKAIPEPHLPVLGCNMDLMWMNETHLPRFGHGSFLVCLETLYQKITGRELIYTILTGKPSQITYHYAEHVLSQQAKQMGIVKPLRTLYAIGDNPMTDIYGANLYNQYLSHRGIKRLKNTADIKSAIAQQSTMRSPNGHSGYVDKVDITFGESAEMMESVLVYTGVHSKSAAVEMIDSSGDLTAIDHGHRDFKYCPDLSRPTLEVKNVFEAVKTIFSRENYGPGNL